MVSNAQRLIAEETKGTSAAPFNQLTYLTVLE